ncbi:acyl carrier protein [Flavihumibacter stibioxidans]|uniref:Phosphopantetheine-binding protein n=1 Tax=Flavihumibacter stibioxidans TaxID=1834163 RepID=A0ABR7M520_9BACT|nr:phosphopantetheine-binding protein [Flavihumibacter stibioxidans]MBC6490115.1 phosphopantetheine-binding protein [Flavihumibacter stibioxidans]
MKEEEIRQLVCQLLKQVAPDSEPEKLAEDDIIRDVLGIDSFDALQFLMALDERTGVDIPEEDYGKISTLAKVVEYVGRKIIRFPEDHHPCRF